MTQEGDDLNMCIRTPHLAAEFIRNLRDAIQGLLDEYNPDGLENTEAVKIAQGLLKGRTLIDD